MDFYFYKVFNLILQSAKVYYPHKKEVAAYQKMFPLYREIENDLATSYQKLSSFQKMHSKN